MRPLLFAAAVFAPLALVQASQAAEQPPVTISGKIGVVSDYRFRGVSFSNDEMALQGGLTATAANGLYGWVWGSTIADYGGANTEADFGLGWTFTAGGTTFDVSAARYGYVDAPDMDYWEIPVAASRTTGDWTWGLGFAWSPEQDALGGLDNRYGYARASWTSPNAPLTVAAQVGYEDGAFAPDGKWDWSLGFNRKIKAVDLGLIYIGSDRAPDTVVASVIAGF